MRFLFNPFTKKLDLTDPEANLQVETITGNDSVAVGPSGGNIFLLGNTLQGVTVSGNAGTNTLTINVAGGGIEWNATSASTTMVPGNGYLCNSGGAISLALPTTSVFGDVVKVILDGSTSWSITQGAGQQIRLGNITTTLGVGGSLSSNQQGDTVELVCKTANTLWTALGSVGGLTVT